MLYLVLIIIGGYIYTLERLTKSCKTFYLNCIKLAKSIKLNLKPKIKLAIIVLENFKTYLRKINFDQFSKIKFLRVKYLPHYSVTIISIIIVISNLYFTKLSYAGDGSELGFIEINPNEAIEIIADLAIYTPILAEDVNSIKNDLAINSNDGYMDKNETITTEASKLEVNYIVQKGDTISKIAQKFNLHVATIVDRNQISIDQIEKIHEGQNIVIPPKDTSDSQDWLAQLNQKKEQARQLALKEQAKKKKLAVSSRTTITRERADSGYEGNSDGWINPTPYKYISRGISRGHYGIDMVENIGSSVWAAKGGRVIEITKNWGSGYGNSILIDHGNGETSRYAHLSSFNVGIGDYVSQEQQIGLSGNTGWSTGPHLHFEVRVNGRAVNPFK